MCLINWYVCVKHIRHYPLSPTPQLLRPFTNLSSSFAKLPKSTISVIMFVCLSVCLSAMKNSTTVGRIFMKFGTWVIFANSSRKFKFHYGMTRITGTVHEDQWTFLYHISLTSCNYKYFRQISMFHRAFFNSIIDKHQHMHFFTFKTVLV